MASFYWIKLYHEILDDPKMGLMNAELFSFTIKLFLVAGEHERDGELPPIKHIAWRLHMDEKTCNELLHELKRNGIVNCNDDQAIFTVANFEERQQSVPVKERVRQHRKRAKNSRKSSKKDQNPPKSPDEGVTKRYTDKDIDKDNTTTITPAEEVATYFQTQTGKCPRGIVETQTWTDDCQEIIDKAEGDVTRARGLIDEAIAVLIELNYPRNRPAGLLATIDNLLKPKPQRNGANKNGRSAKLQRGSKKEQTPEWAERYSKILTGKDS